MWAACILNSIRASRASFDGTQLSVCGRCLSRVQQPSLFRQTARRCAIGRISTLATAQGPISSVLSQTEISLDLTVTRPLGGLPRHRLSPFEPPGEIKAILRPRAIMRLGDGISASRRVSPSVDVILGLRSELVASTRPRSVLLQPAAVDGQRLFWLRYSDAANPVIGSRSSSPRPAASSAHPANARHALPRPRD